ncbi:MAG: adenylate kinase [Cyanobacteria bacterium P01_H01_bin.21]
MVRLIFLGAPGAGKGTQAEVLASDKKIAHISTGDILRQAVAEESELGLQAKVYIDRGDLVPDSLVIELIQNRLDQADTSNGWILDGFPRNLSQAIALQKLLKEIKQVCDHVISFEVPTETLVTRMLERGRKDDNEVTVRRRLNVFVEQTVPLINFYKQLGYLKTINGTESVAEVAIALKRSIFNDPDQVMS